MKYYTPKIEEFHVGFEYEVELNSGEWVKHEISTLSELNFEDWSVKQNDVRVKFLDIEDIKSLGWEEQYGKYVIDKSTDFPNERIIFTLLFNGSTNIEIFKTSLTSYRNHNEKMQFKINNKSEFRKLMYQLNVL